ncbi:MAG: hypothetical protein CMJ74_06485 [Planctomycetaceae bacterium]|nr:hypothetical protein [Planctomycetaceae bacterium]
MRSPFSLHRRRARLRFHRKKRGTRLSGSRSLASVGELFLFTACLTVGAVAMGLIVYWFVLPQWRVNRHFVRTNCQVIRHPGMKKTTGKDASLWQPTITYRYRANGSTYIGRNYDLLDSRYPSRNKAEAIKDSFKLGQQYPCWYDPLDPGTSVLFSGNPLAYWLLLIPVAFLAIGFGGLGYTLWQFTTSRERRAALAQQAAGRELFDEDQDETKLPAIPRIEGVSGSPGTTLAYRLPIAARMGWQLFAIAIGTACWNAVVALFVFLGIRRVLAGEADWILLVALLPFLIAGIWLIVHLTRLFWKMSGIGPTRIEICSHPVRPGETYKLLFVQTGNMLLDSLNVKLECEEESVFQQGTNSITASRVVCRQDVFEGVNISVDAGQPFEHHHTLMIPASAMHSFISPHNRISWRLSVTARVNKRAGYHRDFPLIVIPGKIESDTHSGASA